MLYASETPSFCLPPTFLCCMLCPIIPLRHVSHASCTQLEHHLPQEVLISCLQAEDSLCSELILLLRCILSSVSVSSKKLRVV
jgi:hypothetical protein